MTTGSAATTAARQATSTLPIVMVSAGDEPSLVSAGLIASLAHPGGNVTGTTNAPSPLVGKNVDLNRELVPRVARIAILVNPTNAGAAEEVKAATGAASKAGIGVVVAEVAQAEDFSKAFATIHSAHPDGLIVSVARDDRLGAIRVRPQM